MAFLQLSLSEILFLSPNLSNLQQRSVHSETIKMITNPNDIWNKTNFCAIQLDHC